MDRMSERISPDPGPPFEEMSPEIAHDLFSWAPDAFARAPGDRTADLPGSVQGYEGNTRQARAAEDAMSVFNECQGS
jgi:hypothetical protein